MRVGFVGLGQMGSALAGRLVEQGFEVAVFDLDPDATGRLVDRGATAAASAAELAGTCPVVSVCVPAAEHVGEVMAGAEGLVRGAGPGLTALIHSTLLPGEMAAVADSGSAAGIAVHDACVAGGPRAAAAGELVVFAGGLDTLSPDGRAVLEALASKVIDSGPIGRGAALKVAVNVMTYAQQAAAAAAFDVARAGGADPHAVVEAWRHTGQLGQLTEQFLPVLSIPPADVTGDLRRYLAATVAIAAKDLGLAADMLASVAGRRVEPSMLDEWRVALPAVFGVEGDERSEP